MLNKVDSMDKKEDFTPFPMMNGGHMQTIIASFINFQKAPDSQKRLIDLPDGDKVAIEVNTPPNWKNSDRTVVLIHGLGGSHKSSYLIRMAKKLYGKGIRSIRLNMRNCGSGRGFAKKVYHSGSSEDVLVVLETLKKETLFSPFTLVGFSLGGNIALKLAGELSYKARHIIDNVLAINPPVNVYSSMELLSKKENRLYKRYFLKYLKEDIDSRHAKHKDLPDLDVTLDMSLSDFNKHYIVPQHGFKDETEYYKLSSSLPLIKDISLPCHILLAKDDPIVDWKEVMNQERPKNVNIMLTNSGGHLGFLSSPFKGKGLHWMDSQLLKWISESKL